MPGYPVFSVGGARSAEIARGGLSMDFLGEGFPAGVLLDDRLFCPSFRRGVPAPNNVSEPRWGMFHYGRQQDPKARENTGLLNCDRKSTEQVQRGRLVGLSRESRFREGHAVRGEIAALRLLPEAQTFLERGPAAVGWPASGVFACFWGAPCRLLDREEVRLAEGGHTQASAAARVDRSKTWDSGQPGGGRRPAVSGDRRTDGRPRRPGRPTRIGSGGVPQFRIVNMTVLLTVWMLDGAPTLTVTNAV